MRKSAYVVLSYALLVILGGGMGFFLANSLPSLITGSTFGFFILLNARKLFKNNPKGQTMALIQSLILGAFFVYRWRASHKMFPALPMVLASALVAFYLLKTHPTEKEILEKR